SEQRRRQRADRAAQELAIYFTLKVSGIYCTVFAAKFSTPSRTSCAQLLRQNFRAAFERTQLGRPRINGVIKRMQTVIECGKSLLRSKAAYVSSGGRNLFELSK